MKQIALIAIFGLFQLSYGILEIQEGKKTQVLSTI
jgi:hypothetical protein